MTIYEALVNKCNQNGCVLEMIIDDFKTFEIGKNPLISYKATCGHLDTSRYKYFMYCKKKFNCKKCTYINTGILLKNKDFSPHGQEDSCFGDIKKIIETCFIVKKCGEFCKADFVIKPSTCDENKWLPIQLKTTSKIDNYSFKLHNNEYGDCIILCYSMSDQKYWLFEGNKLKQMKGLTIGKYSSKYDKNEIIVDDLVTVLFGYYEKSKKFKIEFINQWLSKNHRVEQEYRMLREKNITFLEFAYPSENQLVYDFTINGKKIQEKTGHIRYNNYIQFTVEKGSGKYQRQSYKEGDNDFYWLNCPDNEHFLIVPEQYVVNKHKISINLDDKDKWYNKYLFKYSEVEDNQEVILGLFE